MSRKDQPRIKTEEIKKVLLLRPKRLGDIILTTPALLALKNCLPDVSISYLLEAPYLRLIEGNGLVQEVLTIEPKAGWISLWRLINHLRRQHFDIAIDFHGGPRSSLLTMASGSRVKVGYRTKYRAWVYHLQVPRRSPSGPIHSVVNHLNLIRALGLEVGNDFPLFLPPSRPEEREKIDLLWKEFQFFSRKVIAFHISAGNRFRDWGLKNIISFLEKISSSRELAVILLGSAEDKLREKEIKTFLGQALPSAVGRVSLGELVALLERVSLFIGPDSGPMHLAAATGRPIVALFGPTLPAHFGPWKAKAIILEKPFPCRPCRQRSCPEKEFPCLRTIKPEEVLAACLELLSSCS